MNADEIYAEDVDWKATATALQAEVTRLRVVERAATAYVDDPLNPLRVEALVHALRPREGS